MTETSKGWLITPATDLIKDMKRRGNQTIQMSSTMIMPPMPYFTTFFFFCPRGWGYLCNGKIYTRLRPLPLEKQMGRMGALPMGL